MELFASLVALVARAELVDTEFVSIEVAIGPIEAAVASIEAAVEIADRACPNTCPEACTVIVATSAEMWMPRTDLTEISFFLLLGPPLA